MKTDDLLKHVGIFLGLGNAPIADLSAISIRKEFNKGEIIFSEGDIASSLYVMDDGDVHLVKISRDGRNQLVRRVTCGDIFAEAAVFSGKAYPATAIANTKSSVVMIDKKRFLSFIKEHPEVSLQIMGAMSQLLRHLNSLLADMSLDGVSQRLAAYLLRRSKEDGMNFNLGFSKAELAFRLGTVPETLSRNLRKLSSEGAISVSGRTIEIKDVTVLKKNIS